MVTLSIVVIVLIIRAMIKKNKIAVAVSAPVIKKSKEIAVGVATKGADPDRKKEFEIHQAEFDAEFLERKIDAQFEEYWQIKDEIAESKKRVEEYEQARHYERANKERKEIARLYKKLSSLDSAIHANEKKLRTAQFKAGQKVLS